MSEEMQPPLSRKVRHVSLRRRIAALAAVALGLGAGLLGALSPGCSSSNCSFIDEERIRCGNECVSLYDDRRHCGACFNACPDPPGKNAWCADRQCYAAEDLNIHGTTVEGLALDGATLYFTTGCSGWVKRHPTHGAYSEVVASAQPGAGPIAVDATRAYWGIACQPPSCCAGSTEIASAPLGGGAVEGLALADLPSAQALALDADRVYWTSEQGVFSVAKAGGAVTTLIDGGSFGAIAVTGKYIYAAGYRPTLSQDWSYDVYRIGLAGGPAERLTEGRQVQSLATDSSYLYLAGCAGVAISKIPLGGGAEIDLGVQSGLPPTCDGLQPRLVVGGGNLYWSAGSWVHRLSVAGGAPERLLVLPGSGRAGTLGLDDERLYVSTGDAVLAVAR